jgi:rubrerythrin
MKVRVWRCRICGDPYIGAVPPSNCPFCGAHAEYIILASDWDDPKVENLNDQDRGNLEKALGIENSNTAFYRCSATKADEEGDFEGFATFKALSKVENEHASIIRKMLGLPKPESEPTEECHDAYIDNVGESLKRETRATSFYSDSAAVASDPRVKEVFAALVLIETDHIQLDEDKLAKLES